MYIEMQTMEKILEFIDAHLNIFQREMASFLLYESLEAGDRARHEIREINKEFKRLRDAMLARDKEIRKTRKAKREEMEKQNEKVSGHSPHNKQ